MCIHVISVTSNGPWTQHQDVRGHIPFIPCILVGTTSGYTVKSAADQEYAPPPGGLYLENCPQIQSKAKTVNLLSTIRLAQSILKRNFPSVDKPLPKKAPQKGPLKNISPGAYFRNFTVPHLPGVPPPSCKQALTGSCVYLLYPSIFPSQINIISTKKKFAAH